MRQRLVLSYLSVAVVVLLALEIPFAIQTYRHERDSLVSQATNQATGVAVVVAQDVVHDQKGALRDLVRRYHMAAGANVLVVMRDGWAAADSDADAPSDVARLRPRIERVLQGSTVSTWTSERGRSTVVAGVPVHGTRSAEVTVAGAVMLSLPADPTDDRIHTAWLLLGVFALISLALTGLLGARIAADLTRPLAKLEAAVSRLGDGELSERAAPEGPRELRALARAFNGMAERIEDLVSAQSRFVADASHQLRSPLTALRLRLENLESDVGGAAEESLGAAEREVQRLSRLVDGLLTLSRAEGDRPEREAVDVWEVVEERVEVWEPLATERGVDIRLAGADLEDPVMSLIPGDLDQIVDNLLANSLDASPEGGAISVEVRQTPAGTDTPAGIEIAIVDQGPGMSDEALARAFDRFWQGGTSGSGGSGLGLAIVLQLAHRNGAEVQLLPPPPRPGWAKVVQGSGAAGGSALAGRRSSVGGGRVGDGEGDQDAGDGGPPALGPGLLALVHLRALDP